MRVRFPPTACAHLESAILHSVPVADSGNFVQDDGMGLGGFAGAEAGTD